MNPFNRFRPRAGHRTPAPGTKSPIPNEATVLDADGEAIGVILAFADNGYLSALEIYDWTDPEGISPLPPLERLELRVER
jgi:hypothetical protein